MLVGKDQESALLMMFMGVFLKRVMVVESLEMRDLFLCDVDNKFTDVV